MTPSDIIAVVAIIISAVASILSVHISYKNNKENIAIKRPEIAFEKRHDALRLISIDTTKGERIMPKTKGAIALS